MLSHRALHLSSIPSHHHFSHTAHQHGHLIQVFHRIQAHRPLARFRHARLCPATPSPPSFPSRFRLLPSPLLQVHRRHLCPLTRLRHPTPVLQAARGLARRLLVCAHQGTHRQPRHDQALRGRPVPYRRLGRRHCRRWLGRAHVCVQAGEGAARVEDYDYRSGGRAWGRSVARRAADECHGGSQAGG